MNQRAMMINKYNNLLEEIVKIKHLEVKAIEARKAHKGNLEYLKSKLLDI